MKQRIKFLQILFLSLAFSFAFTTPTFAKFDLCPKDTGGASGFAQLCTKAFSGDAAGNLIGFGITLAFIIAVVLALFFLIWGGIKWILSGGDKGGVEAARGTIVAAVIGLVVTFAAYFILNIVLSFFGLSIENITLPKL